MERNEAWDSVRLRTIRIHLPTKTTYNRLQLQGRKMLRTGTWSRQRNNKNVMRKRSRLKVKPSMDDHYDKGTLLWKRLDTTPLSRPRQQQSLTLISEHGVTVHNAVILLAINVKLTATPHSQLPPLLRPLCTLLIRGTHRATIVAVLSLPPDIP